MMKSNLKTTATFIVLAIMFFWFAGCDQNGLTGDPVRGGLLYDKWWNVAGVSDSTEPTGDHSLYPSVGEKSGSTTWRCKECHGWDYKGADGAYGSGSHFTDIGGIYGDRNQSESDLTAAFSAGGIMDYSDHLSEQDIADVVAFIKDGLIEMSAYIDVATKEVDGDADNGEMLYAGDGQCVTCHGADGNLLDIDGAGVAEIANDNPWETLHKIRFGHPGSVPEMPSAIDLGLTVQQQVDILAFAVESLGQEMTATMQ